MVGLNSQEFNSIQRANPVNPILAEVPQNVEATILKAAQEEFFHHGFKGTRMQQIADRAGVNKSLLHYYYRSKDKLYVAVLEGLFSKVWNKLTRNFEVQPSGGLKEIVETIVTSYIEVFSENPDFPLFMMQEMKSGNKYIPAAMNALLPSIKYIKKYLLGEIARVVEVKRATHISMDHLLLNIMSMTLGTFLMKPMVESVGPELGIQVQYDGDFYRARIGAIVHMVLHGFLIWDKEVERI